MISYDFQGNELFFLVIEGPENLSECPLPERILDLISVDDAITYVYFSISFCIGKIIDFCDFFPSTEVHGVPLDFFSLEIT